MGRKKLLFFRIWSSPPISASVEQLLQDSFPRYKMETITLWDLIKADRKLLIGNSFAVLKEYGLDILTGSLKFKAAFFRTTYLFDHVCLLVKEIAGRQSNLAFTFQLQSIFDTHIEGVPHFVYTDHTHLANLQYSPQIKVNLYSAEWICREKTIYDHADRIFTRSTNISRSLIEQYGIPEEKVACVYAGANTPIEGIDPDRKDYSARHILFVGLDWKRKGGPDLLEAFQRLQQKYPDATLTIAGSRLSSDLPGVTSLGKVSLVELKRLYQQATIFCMPSRNEPFGIVFVEAMAYALPIVAARIGALPDMVREGENGFLVEPGNVEELTKALDALLANEKERRKFGKHSWQAARDRYNWQSVGSLLRKDIDDFMEGTEWGKQHS